MKLSPRDAAAYFRKPDTTKAGLLIYGQDGMRVALRRQEVIKALTGENAEEEMRLTRLQGADIREAKRVLAHEVTTLAHGEEAALQAAAGIWFCALERL